MKLLLKQWAYFKYILGIKSRQVKECSLNIDYNDAIWVLGCSHVYGTGNTSEQTVTTYLNEISNQLVVNLGYPGSGPMMVEYQLTKLLKSYKPKAVVIAWPNFDRWQSIETNFLGPVLWLPFCLENIKKHNDHFGSKKLWPKSYNQYKKMILHNSVKDVNINSYTNVHNMLKGIKLVEFQYSPDDNFNTIKPCWPWIDLASDNLHPGPNTQKNIAEWIWRQLNDV